MDKESVINEFEATVKKTLEQQFRKGLKYGASGVAGTIYGILKDNGEDKVAAYDKVLEFCEKSLNLKELDLD